MNKTIMIVVLLGMIAAVPAGAADVGKTMPQAVVASDDGTNEPVECFLKSNQSLPVCQD